METIKLSKNKSLSLIFEEMHNLYKKNNDIFRSIACKKVARIIFDYTKEITLDSLEELGKGVGSSSKAKIKEFLNTGKVEKLNVLRNSVDLSKEFCIEDIKSIPGIGYTRAAKLVESGYKTSYQLIAMDLKIGEFIPNTKVRLTNQMYIGLKFMAHTQKDKMSQEVHDSIINPFLTGLKSDNLEGIICGSRRRNKELIGDIDVVIPYNTEEELDLAIMNSHMFLDHIIVEGRSKVSGIKDSKHVDIRFIQNDRVGAMILQITGSAGFNITIRRYAKSKGFKLNEFGLFDRQTGNLIASKTEEGIFDALGLKFVKPEDRKDELIINSIIKE